MTGRCTCTAGLLPAMLLLAMLLLLPPLEVLSQDHFDLADALDDDTDHDKPPTPAPKPAKPAGGDFGLEDLLKVSGHTTKAPPPRVIPKVTKAPVKPKPKPADDDFNLADALDPNNDISGREKNRGKGGGFSGGDRDHIDQQDNNGETTAEVGTIAGIVSAVVVALVGAISSYISYQKKKLCFGLQQSLNTDMVKAENPEGVVATEPQVQQTLLEPPNAEPPTEENTV